MMDIGSERDEGRRQVQMAFQDHIVGNEKLGILHGGAVARLLQVGALQELQLAGESRQARIFNFNIEFLGPAFAKRTWARATVVARSKRFANLSVTAHQNETECKQLLARPYQFQNQRRDSAQAGCSQRRFLIASSRFVGHPLAHSLWRLHS